ncbi:MAG: DUF302 domain-containing protein [Pseudomonadota bacterium]
MKNTVLAAALASAALATPALSQDVHISTYNGSYEDARFSLENAIVNRGLVIDYVSHVGDMLTRTGADVGSNEHLFSEAEIFVFCSASVSRQVMEEDPANLAHCPYGIFVAERRGQVTMGFRDYPAGAMDMVETMLAEIVEEAADF